MADEVNENGTANGDVPEIELIIKVSHFRLFQTKHSSGRAMTVKLSARRE